MNTLPERIVKEFLLKHKIPFEQQVIIKNIGVIDFLIDGIIAIECDGDYWHSLPINKIRDWRRGFLLRYNGYPLFRFKECQIKNESFWKNKILNAWEEIQNAEVM